jgi:glyoxylase-like metal-dependent hydrolase (beta-lactamase superfamily II)
MVMEEIIKFNDRVMGIKVGGSLLGNPLMSVIFYLLDSALIDTGPYCARRTMKGILVEHNVEMALLTHYHEDHAGNARLLVDNGVPVYGHELTVEILKKKNRLKPYEHVMFGKLEQADIEAFPDLVQTNHHTFMPVHAPGHSRDHTVFHDADNGWLFSGDLFLAAKIKYWRKDENMRQTIDSLELVLGLDFDVLFCSHNPQLENPKKYLAMKKDQLISLVEQAQELLSRGFSKNEIIRNMTKNKEKRIAKWFTLGDASYKNMVLSAIQVALEGNVKDMGLRTQ